MAKHEQDVNGQWWYVWEERRGDTSKILRTRVEHQTCEGCGDGFLPKSRGDAKKRRFCGRRCAMRATGKVGHFGEANPVWKGGRKKNAAGYVRVWIPPEERASRGGVLNVLEHRLVMEKIIGRQLLPNEQVHHKNGVRDDNRPENLELWNGSHPEGVRASDVPCCPTCGQRMPVAE